MLIMFYFFLESQILLILSILLIILKFYVVLLSYCLPVNVIMIYRIMRIHMISGAIALPQYPRQHLQGVEALQAPDFFMSENDDLTVG